jgi:hypothetical protein
MVEVYGVHCNKLLAMLMEEIDINRWVRVRVRLG